MPDTLISAEEIAEQQLLAALRMWRENAFIPCITLAGAAEEILGKRLRRIGREPTFDNMKRVIIELARLQGDVDSKTDGIVADLLNRTKNELKHYAEDESLAFDFREDAIELLERATANYTLLTNKLLPEIISFWAAIDAQQRTPEQ